MGLPRAWNMFGDGHPVYRLLLVSKMIDRETASSLQNEFSLSLPEWRVLAFVCGLGSASASEIGQAAEIDRVYRDYPHLTDDHFVAEHLDEWLA